MRNGKTSHKKPFLFALTLFMILWTTAAIAQVKVIEADSVYVMGDNDSKIDARRIATQEAKRKALELTGTYVESLTEVKNYQLTKDDVKVYTAGIVQTDVAAEEWRGSVQHPEVYIKARCTVDTAVLTAQIDKYRENEDLKEQLQNSSKENDALKKERDGLVRQLAAEKDKTRAEDTRKKLDAVLAKEETNDETNRVWTNIGDKLVEVDDGGQEIQQADLDKSAVILERAVKVNPQNQRARYLLAAVYEKNGNVSGAESELRAAIERHPSNPELHLKLGVLLGSKGQYEKALAEFHFVERMRTRHPLMLFHTGMTFKDMGRCQRSVQYLQRFVREPRSNRLPKKKEAALQAIQECGGPRGPLQRRVRQQ